VCDGQWRRHRTDTRWGWGSLAALRIVLVLLLPVGRLQAAREAFRFDHTREAKLVVWSAAAAAIVHAVFFLIAAVGLLHQLTARNQTSALSGQGGWAVGPR
jgi:hypothetical protein